EVTTALASGGREPPVATPIRSAGGRNRGLTPPLAKTNRQSPTGTVPSGTTIEFITPSRRPVAMSASGTPAAGGGALSTPPAGGPASDTVEAGGTVSPADALAAAASTPARPSRPIRTVMADPSGSRAAAIAIRRAHVRPREGTGLYRRFGPVQGAVPRFPSPV